MKITPITQEEAATTNKEFKVYPEGEYPFEIITANEGPSKTSEYSRIAVNMKIYDTDGSYTWVNDYLSSSPKAAFKIRNAAEACGLLENYNAGEITADDFIRKQGFVKVIVESATKDESGNIIYPEKNKVAAYVVKNAPKVDKKALTTKMQAPPKANDMDDEIPF